MPTHFKKPFILLAILVFLGSNLQCKQAQKPPNVLFIAVDDLRTELGAYGHPIVQSPNMDALASEGSVFTNHFVQVPTCGASRYALLTGMRPSKPLHLNNNAIEKEISNAKENNVPETFIHHLKRNGYYTVGIGKISHSADGLVYDYEAPVSTKKELPYSWDELLFDAGKWGTGWNAFFGYANGENRQSLKKQVKPFEAGEVDDEGYPDGLTTKLAISKLRELKDKEQPFFMGVGFFKPHLPFNAPKKYWDLYDREQIPLSPNPNIPGNISLKSLHESGEFNQYALGEEKASLSKSVSDEYSKKLRHAYLASISYIDAQIGMIWDELKVLDLDKTTIIVIWGDHGWHLGDQRVWGKHTLFENALKSALIIKSPFEENQTKKVESIVETVDIYPTIMELCNIDMKHQIDGESFSDSFTGATPKKDQVAYSYFRNGISLRTAKYRLTKYYRQDEPTIELYDHITDPNETENIAQMNPDIIESLMPLLEKGNTGLYGSN
ncbi:sulfatase [Arenibacter sp. BSSL-BM3]|uniref:Sulfatase n=1 Tax=Arenibacter arenosicollis TaxID=2762274 RepID=A0ABR7QIM6_9FLAO|nr:sulfatase [Arenibacter arenosicollis]MBC8767036.1 sulfatase [Arenibacter arenosicollis]